MCTGKELQLQFLLKMEEGENVESFALLVEEKMFEFLKLKSFDYIFSIIIGIGLVAALRPICHGDKCTIEKAPPVDEINHSTYQLGSKCYQFRSEPVDCPKAGAIEGFYSKL